MVKEMANFVEPYLPPGFRTRLQRPGMETGAAGAASPPSPAAPAPGETKPPQ
jgi:hypothetical protein